MHGGQLTRIGLACRLLWRGGASALTTPVSCGGNQAAQEARDAATSKAASVQDARAQVSADEAGLQERTAKLEGLNSQIRAEQAVSAPQMEAAQAAIAGLTEQDIAGLKGVSSPPEPVLLTVEVPLETSEQQ